MGGNTRRGGQARDERKEARLDAAGQKNLLLTKD